MSSGNTPFLLYLPNKRTSALKYLLWCKKNEADLCLESASMCMKWRCLLLDDALDGTAVMECDAEGVGTCG